MMCAMTKRITHDLTYGAPAAEVSAMMGDRAFRERVCEDTGALRHDVTVQADGAGKRVRIEQVQTAQGLPSFATKIVGDEITTVQVERWTSVDHADVDVSIPGKPGEMQGTVDLAGSGERTVETVDMEVTVRVPLVGGKMETFVADMLTKALDTEHRAGVEWLSGS